MGSKDVYLIFIQSQTLFSHVPWTVSTQEKKERGCVITFSLLLQCSLYEPIFDFKGTSSNPKC